MVPNRDQATHMTTKTKTWMMTEGPVCPVNSSSGPLYMIYSCPQSICNRDEVTSRSVVYIWWLSYYHGITPFVVPLWDYGLLGTLFRFYLTLLPIS